MYGDKKWPKYRRNVWIKHTEQFFFYILLFLLSTPCRHRSSPLGNSQGLSQVGRSGRNLRTNRRGIKNQGTGTWYPVLLCLQYPKQQVIHNSAHLKQLNICILIPKSRRVASMVPILRELRKDFNTEPVSFMTLLNKLRKKGSTEWALNKCGRVKATFSKRSTASQI